MNGDIRNLCLATPWFDAVERQSRARHSSVVVLMNTQLKHAGYFPCKGTESPLKPLCNQFTLSQTTPPQTTKLVYAILSQRLK
jgi:hypothetical protein